ncbi:hypothetical protein CVT25_012702 [Psilocybe cyanescens]|uniref:DUF6593 domain-containing protein n=1 Tax=Psilocybe cyanescens TaxID=93625 RepID=A0A409VN44_PSICY|nr:hypothetical protein CVT25_012702 [Psilocybe cyanescens]
MDLYFIPDDPEHTLLVSANGVPHYQIDTDEPFEEQPCITLIQRPGASPEDSIVAEIEWRNRETPTILRCPLLGDAGQCVGMRGIGIRSLHYLYKRYKFGSVRYFVGDDAFEYRWKAVKGAGCVLTRSDSSTEIASSMSVLGTEGVFAGEKKQVLRIQPCTLDIDLIILTFIIMERKRREREGTDNQKGALGSDANSINEVEDEGMVELGDVETGEL